MKKAQVSLTTGETEAFFSRVLDRANALDGGESLTPSITINFEYPSKLQSLLTVERIRLLRQTKAGSMPITELASGLKRDLRSVSRDVLRLEKAGLPRTSHNVNPGHRRYKIVEPLARAYSLVANL